MDIEPKNVRRNECSFFVKKNWEFDNRLNCIKLYENGCIKWSSSQPVGY